MRIMMTGATGHSGKWFIDKLVKEKFDGELVCLVRNELGMASFLRTELPFKMEILSGSIEDKDVLMKSMTEVDIVLNIASIHHSESIIEAAEETGVKWAILVHTTGRYSKYKSASAEYIRIEDEILKRRNERLLRNEDGLDITIVRPTMIYGSQLDVNMHKLIKYLDKHNFYPIFGHGENLMQPVHARDLGYAYYNIIRRPENTKNREYNLSGKDVLTYREIIKITSKELGCSVRLINIPFRLSLYSARIYNYIFGSRAIISVEQVLRMQEDKAFSHEEAAKDFGFNPIGFEEGIREEVRIMKSKGII